MPYKKGTKWVGQVRKNQKRKEAIFKTRTEALDWETDQRKLPAENWSKKTDMICLFDWADQYLEYSEKFSEKTFKEKQDVLRRFLKFAGAEYQVLSLTAGQALKFLQCEFKKRSGYAANKDRKNLVAGWNWGMKYMALPAPNPFLVDKFPEVRKARYIPPEKDFWTLYDSVTGQDKVMLLCFLHMAARRGELFRLRWDDFDFEERKVRLSTRKRKDGSLEFDWLPLTPELYDALLKHRQASEGPWVFTDSTGASYLKRQNWMKRVCKRAGVKYFGFHAIRHLTASILAKHNIPMIDIQAILRHKNLATTERYLKRMSNLRVALQVLSGGKSRLAEPSDTARQNREKEVVS